MKKELCGVKSPLDWLPPCPVAAPVKVGLLLHVRVQKLCRFWGELGFVFTAAWAWVGELCVGLMCTESVLTSTHMDMRIVEGSHLNVMRMHLALSTGGPVLRWQ